MSKYRFKGEGGRDESDYESDGGTHYRPQKILGQGSYSEARKFQSKNGKETAVIKPRNIKCIDFDEVKAKYRFFKAIYPDKVVKLIKKRSTYRLITPLIPGESYNKLTIDTREQRILFLSAVKALRNCHNKGYIVVDLKEDNIHYDKDTGESYLIDGGLAVKEGRFVNPGTFKQAYKRDVQQKRAEYYHIAPECWSTTVVAARKSMDIYSLGNMMARIMRRNADPFLRKITQLCQDRIITNRPSLDTLEAVLEIQLDEKITNIKRDITLIHDEILKIQVDFSDKKNLQDMEKHRIILLERLNSLLPSSENTTIYQILGLQSSTESIKKAVNAKKQEVDDISKRCKIRYEEIDTRVRSISEILERLENNINSPEHYHSKKGREEGQNLLTNLKIHRDNYSNKLFSNSGKPDEDDAASQAFKEACWRDINIAKPILAEEFGWEDYLTNLAIALFNIPIKVATLGYCGSFFEPIQSKSIEEINRAAKSMELIADLKIS